MNEALNKLYKIVGKYGQVDLKAWVDEYVHGLYVSYSYDRRIFAESKENQKSYLAHMEAAAFSSLAGELQQSVVQNKRHITWPLVRG